MSRWISCLFIVALMLACVSALKAAADEGPYVPSVSLSERFVDEQIELVREELDMSFEPLFYLGSTNWMRSQVIASVDGALRVAVFDVGSTGIRVTVADIYEDCGRVAVLAYFKYPMEFGVHEGNAKDRIAAIGGIRQSIETVFGCGIYYEAVATAGFRAAGDYGQELAGAIEFVTGVAFKVIDQDEEGLLAFNAALMHHPESNVEDVVVWDIGGGSMQFTAQLDDALLTMAGCRVASRTFMAETLRFVKSDIGLESPNPIHEDGVRKAIQLAKKLLLKGYHDAKDKAFDLDILSLIGERVEAGATVFGVGGVHTHLVLGFVKAMLDENATSYTQSDLCVLIEMLAEYTDDQILELARSRGHTELDSSHSVVTSLILVCAVFDIMGIHRVHVVPADNTDGLLARSVQRVLASERILP